MMWTSVAGYAASVLSTVAFLPQAVYVVRSRDTQSISLLTYAIFVLSVVLWFCYGLALHNIPIVWSNAVCIVFGGVILGHKLRDVFAARKKNRKEGAADGPK